MKRMCTPRGSPVLTDRPLQIASAAGTAISRPTSLRRPEPAREAVMTVLTLQIEKKDWELYETSLRSAIRAAPDRACGPVASA